MTTDTPQLPNRTCLLATVIALLLTLAGVVDRASGQISFPAAGGGGPVRLADGGIIPRTRDSAGIQAAIELATKMATHVALEEGTYFIGTTIVIDRQWGVDVRGVRTGMDQAAGWPQKQGKQRVGTVLLWTGPRDGTMIHLKCCAAPKFSNLFLDAGEQAAGIGFLLSTEDGWPTTGVRFSRVSVVRAKVGFAFGLDAREHLNDFVVFEQSEALYCDVGIQIRNEQCLHVRLKEFTFRDCDVGLDIIRGGHLLIENASSIKTNTFIRARETAGGANTGPVTVLNARIENGGLTRRDTTVIDAPNGDVMAFHLIGLAVTDGPKVSETDGGNYLFHIGQKRRVSSESACYYGTRIADVATGGAFFDRTSFYRAIEPPSGVRVVPESVVTIEDAVDYNGKRMKGMRQ